MEKHIYPCLWFDGQAKEAAQFYCSVFRNSRILDETPLVVTFDLDGRKFIGLNGGPLYKFTEAVSFVVECDTQEEIDYYWDAFTREGEESMCGWLRDKYGVSWQIMPTILPELMYNPVVGKQVMNELLKMRKLDLGILLKAAGR